MQFLVKEGRTNLVHRDGTRKGGQCQERIEKNGDHITHNWHGAKGRLEDIGQGYEQQSGTAVRIYSYGERGGEDDKSRQHCYHGVDARNLQRRLGKVCAPTEI